MFESTGWVLEEPEIADTAKYDLLVPAIVKPGEKISLSRKCSNLSDTNRLSGSRKCSILSDAQIQYQRNVDSRKCSIMSEIIEVY